MTVKQKLLLLLWKIVFYALIAIGILFVVRLLFNQWDSNFLLFDLRIGLGEWTQMESEIENKDSQSRDVDPDDEYIESILPKKSSSSKNDVEDSNVWAWDAGTSGTDSWSRQALSGWNEQQDLGDEEWSDGDRSENEPSLEKNTISGDSENSLNQWDNDASLNNQNVDAWGLDTGVSWVSYSLPIHWNSGVIYTKPWSPQYWGYPLARLQSHTNFTKEPEKTLAEYSESISTQWTGGVEFTPPTEYRMDSSWVFRSSSFYN